MTTISKIALRNMLDGRHKGDRQAFGRELLHLAGVRDAHGNPYHSRGGQRELREALDETGKPVPRLALTDHSIRNLAEVMLGGEDAVERWLKPNLVHETLIATDGRSVLEAGTNAQMPSQFANINAFTGVVAGLLEAGIMEAFQNPEYVISKMIPTKPSRQFEGRKEIGIARPGDVMEERQPGMPTKRFNLGEHWMTQPRTVENSGAIEVTQEAVFLDQTGQLSEQANSGGDWLAYRKELRCIDVFIGVVNNFNYKGTAYNSFISAGYFDNVVASNELLYTDNLLAAEIKFRDMTDPDTGTRVLMSPNTMVVNREYVGFAAAVNGGDTLMYRSKPADGAGVRQQYTSGPSVYKARGYDVIESALVFERITAANGLNLSTSNGKKYWWLFDRNKYMVYVENWGIRTQTAAPGQLDMIDRGVVLYTKADERGIPWVVQPRACVESTN